MAPGCQKERSAPREPATPDCASVARHTVELTPPDLRAVDAKELAEMCERDTTPEQRRCVMAATTFEAFRRCGPEGASDGALPDVAQATPAPPRPDPASTPPVDPALVRQATAALRTAAQPCALDGKRVEVKYTLVVEKGEAHAEDPELAGADLAPETHECLARAIAAARWKVSAPDARVEVSDGLGR